MTIPNDIIEKMISKFEAGYNCTQLDIIHNRTKIKETGKAYSVRFGGNIQSRRFFIIYMMMLQFT